jgi:hypothetical protein
MSFGAQARAVGTYPVLDAATLELSFDRGQPYRGTLPIPTIEVVDAPTLTPTPPAETPTPGPTIEVRPVFLPLAFNRECRGLKLPIDFAVAVDTSASMLQRLSGGGVPLDFAMRGSAAAIDGLALPDDRASVVGFGDGTVQLSQLTGSRGTLISALGRLYTIVGHTSFLGPAIERAASTLPGDAGRKMVLLLITDGFPDVDAAVAAAAAARARGIELYGVGVAGGQNVDRLTNVAGSGTNVFVAAQHEGLEPLAVRARQAIECSARGR